MPQQKPLIMPADPAVPGGTAPWKFILPGMLLVWTYLALCFPLYDTDFWWHLKTGELILAQGKLPQVDWYTFTDADKPWIDLHWGFQILVTWLYHLGGVNLVILTKAAVITLAIAVAYSAGGRSLPAWKKTLLWVLPAVCIAGRGYERPEMLSQLFLAVWLWIVRRVEVRPGLIWLLPLVQLIWINCHALFVLGLVVGACYLADAVAREFAQGRWFLEPPAAEPSARAVIWAGALIVLAALANPYFEEGALFPLTLYRKFSTDQEAYSSIGEFLQPITFFQRHGLWFKHLLAEIGVWCVAAASFVTLLVRRRRISVLRLLLFAGFSHLAWKATRNTNIFAFVSAWVACENFADALAAEVPAPRAAAVRRGFPVPQWSVVALLSAMMVAVVTGAWNSIDHGNQPFGLGEAPRWFIHGAAKFAGREGFPKLAFVANNGQAAVYIYHNAPERLVFMDGRLEVCSFETWTYYNAILVAMAQGDSGWQQIFRTAGGELPVVILDSRGEMSRAAINGLLNTRGWRLVFADAAGAVLLSDAQADRLSLPAVDPEPLKYPDGRPAERDDDSSRSRKRRKP